MYLYELLEYLVIKAIFIVLTCEMTRGLGIKLKFISRVGRAKLYYIAHYEGYTAYKLQDFLAVGFQNHQQWEVRGLGISEKKSWIFSTRCGVSENSAKIICRVTYTIRNVKQKIYVFYKILGKLHYICNKKKL